jgi:hypothetical protein
MAQPPQKPGLILHIGHEKTGTTTLQNIGNMNRDALLGAGILYPSTPGFANHINLTMYASDGPRAARLKRIPSYHTEEGRDAFRNEFYNDFRAEIQQASAPYVWLSNEHLSSRLQTPQEMARLCHLFDGLFSSVKIIIYLRRQSDLYQSLQSTSAKSGGLQDMPVPKKDVSPFYNFEKLLDFWSAPFGMDALRVRIYDRELLVNGDIVADFFTATGLPAVADLKRVAEANPRLDRATLTFMQLFNKFVPVGDPNLAPLRGNIDVLLERIASGQPYTLPSQDMRALDTVFAASNDRVAHRYLGREGPLFPPRPYAEPETGPALTMEQAVEIAAKLWCLKQPPRPPGKKTAPDVSPAAASGQNRGFL